ncbi:phosphatidate cytidylyltransferase [Cloacibacterium sp. Arc13]|uniref:phosphatidate cytidylyltransferase n=1 Tax=unclassified Cloacibacterium TaxID=2620870 RepID=UPI00352E1014
MDKNLIQRVGSGLIYGLLTFLCTTEYGAILINKISPDLVKPHQLFYGLITFFLVVGTYEGVRIMKFQGNLYQWLVLPLVALVYYKFTTRFFGFGFYYTFDLSEILALSLILIAAITLFKFPQELYQDEGKLIFIVIYTVLPFGFALGLPKYFLNDNAFTWEVFLLFVLIWSSDSFAYFTGRMFGKHKMAPKISPKKTWEGFAGGVFFTLILGYFIEQKFPDLRGNWIVVGLLVSIFAPLGDLVESQLKRTFGVKDSGNIIPGHGGVLDRLDSFIIAAPVVYLYFILENIF